MHLLLTGKLNSVKRLNVILDKQIRKIRWAYKFVELNGVFYNTG